MTNHPLAQGEQRPSPALHVLGRALLVLVIDAAALALAYCLTNLALKIVLAAQTGEWHVLALVALFNPKFMAILVLLPLLAGARRRLRRLDGGAGGLQRWAALSLVLALPAGALFLWHQAGFSRTPNRLGFYTCRDPHVDVRGREWNPHVPEMHIVTNALGYRDEEWPTQPSVRRALLVGDSFVWGVGIVEKAGTLDARIEAELNGGRGAPRWQVVNLGEKPAGLPYYMAALQAASAELQPDVLVLGFLRHADDLLLDEPTLLRHRSPRFAGLLLATGVLQDFMEFNAIAVWNSWYRELVQERERPELQARFAAFLRTLEARRTPLIVVEYDGRDPLFDPFRKHPLITWVGWSDVAWQGKPWQDLPGYAVPGDGHPTELTNRAFAAVIAQRIRAVTVAEKP